MERATKRVTSSRALAMVAVGVVIVGVVGRSQSFASGSHPEGDSAILSAAAGDLKSSHEITVTSADPREPHSVSQAQALETATREAAFLGGESPSAHLVYFTDPWYGKQASDSDAAPVIPFSEHRLSWLVLIRHAESVPLGPSGRRVQPQPVTAAAFVDANSGKLIKISTLKDF